VKRAAFSVVQHHPRVSPPNTPGTYPQPQIPLIVSRSLTRMAISNQQRERWYQSLAEHLDRDHLSRIQLSTTFNERFSAGNRATQSILAQLRFGHSTLNAHKAQLDGSDPTCSCGAAPETTSHYLLECPLFANERFILETKVNRLLPPDQYCTERILLGAPDPNVTSNLYRKISSFLSDYFRKTKRFHQDK